MRHWLAGLAFLGALIAMITAAGPRIAAGDPHMIGALLGGLVAALATAVGTVPVLLARRPSQRMNDTMMGFGAGVMLAATSFSLILPGLEMAGQQGAGAWGASITVGIGILLGAVALLLLDRFTPHEHFIKGPEGAYTPQMRRVWLFVGAIVLHNVPEGLAIGVAFAGPDLVGARALAAGIAIQDIPEGLVVALALMGAGYSRATACTIGVLSGLVEPVAALAGAVLVSLSAVFLPWGLAFAAGAMLFVISHEILPESHRQGHEVWATGGLMLGFVLMMVLDTAMG